MHTDNGGELPFEAPDPSTPGTGGSGGNGNNAPLRGGKFGVFEGAA